jgi:hypothetical protein
VEILVDLSWALLLINMAFTADHKTAVRKCLPSKRLSFQFGTSFSLELWSRL